MTKPIGFRSGLAEGAVTTCPGTLTVDAAARLGERAHDDLARGRMDYSRELASLWQARHLVGPVGAYGEILGATRERPGGGATGYLHGGLAFLIRPWMQADVHGGLGSRSAGSPRWVGVGVRQRAAR
jgi:hypothetical protein